MKKISLRTKITSFAQGQPRPGLGRKNENTMKTKTKISGYILRSSAAALLLFCGIVALSSASNPKFPTSQNGHGSFPSGGGPSTHTPMGGCLPNDYTITTGSG